MDVERRKKTEEEIKEVETLIVNNSKDALFAKGLVQRLSGLYQMDKLIDVPTSDIVEVIDFGACVIYRLRTGYMFEAKGGMQTYISLRMQSICTMLQTLFDLHNKEDKTEDENTIYDAFSSAILYCCQCLIFASMNEESLYGIATDILKRFNEYCAENYEKAEVREETEADIKANIEAENFNTAIQTLVDSPLPPEDTDS